MALVGIMVEEGAGVDALGGQAAFFALFEREFPLECARRIERLGIAAELVRAGGFITNG